MEDALTSFREKWRKELTTPNNQPLLAIAKYDSPQESDIEDKVRFENKHCICNHKRVLTIFTLCIIGEGLVFERL